MNPRLKIFMLVNNLDIGNRGGGAEIFAVNLAIELRQAGLDVILGILSQINSSNETLWLEKLDSVNIPHFFLNPGVRRDLLRSYQKAVDICLKFRPDIIHSHCQIGSVSAVILKIKKYPRFIIRTVHANLEWGSGPIGYVARSIFSYYLFPRFFDVQVGVTNAIYSRLMKFTPSRLIKKRNVVIHNALPRSFQKNAADRYVLRQTPLGSRWELITVGRLTKNKGYDDLLKALPLVLDRHPDVHLSIVGEGELHQELNDLAQKLGVHQQVTFTGQRMDVPDLLLNSDLFVLPSHSEGLPTVLLEAIACGVPVIATKLTGVQEIITDQQNGWLVEPQNPTALADAIIRAIDDPAELGRVRAESLNRLTKFSFDTVTREYLKLYDDLVVSK